MKKIYFLVLAGFAIILVIGAGITLRAGAPANENCNIELGKRVESPDGVLAAEHRIGVCDDEKSLIHTLEISPSNKKSDEKVIGAVLFRAQGADVKPLGLSMRFGLRWLDNSQFEVSYPKGMPFSEPYVLNGVRVLGRETK